MISAPSGAGKHAILTELFKLEGMPAYSVSATTRVPREGEVEGKDYFFLSEVEFMRRAESGDFVEWAEVHGNYYGTPKAELLGLLEDGSDVIVEVDVQGMRKMCEVIGGCVTVFVVPPEMEELERRLLKRGTDSVVEIGLRLENARKEMAVRHEFDHIVVNDVLSGAVEELDGIIKSERRKRRV